MDISSTPRKPIYSIVIPAYNEEFVIENTIEQLHKYLVEQNLHDSTEVIFVTANPTDRTIEIIENLKIRFTYFKIIKPGNKVGKGRDVRIGMLAASGEKVLFTDADLATPVNHIKPAFELLDSFDIVIGKRNLKTIHKGYRSLVSRMTNLVTRLIILPKIYDTQCGFKAFTHTASKEIFSRSSIDKWGFDVEVLALARKRGFVITHIDIDDWDDPKLKAGLVGEHPIISIATSLLDLLRIRLRLWVGHYKK